MHNNVGLGIRDNQWDAIESISTVRLYDDSIGRGVFDGFSLLDLGVRVCSQCNTPKDISAMAMAAPDRFKNICKSCHSENMRVRYHSLANRGLFDSRKHQRRGSGCSLVPMPQIKNMRGTRLLKQRIPDDDLFTLLRYGLIEIRGL